MDLPPIPEIVDGLPNLSGYETKIEELIRQRVSQPIYLQQTNLKWERIQATFAIALHMQQPLIPAGGSDLHRADIVSNLDFMLHQGSDGDRYNASVFADCYGRIGDIVADLVRDGKNPRVMLDYSGELLYGLRKMGRGDILDRLRPITNDPHLRRHVEWLGTMWGHAVPSSTPLPDLKLHIRAWQHNFAAVFGWEALTRVRGFSPPEMHLPNHPDAAYAYVRALRECGYQWLLVQEHTVEGMDGQGLADKYVPHRLLARNSEGEEVSILAVIKTQGSDTKLVAQMQPLYEARGQHPRTLGSVHLPPIVAQIGDGENGGVMMNEFPSGYRNAFQQVGTEGVVGVNVTEYLELMESAGVKHHQLPACRPLHQGKVFAHIQSWGPGAADRAIAEMKAQNANFHFEGGSWTNNISWVRGYENVLTPMNQLSANFHQALERRQERSGPIDTNAHNYRNALFHLLMAETSCFRYWGQGIWTDYAQEICRRGNAILSNDI